MPLGEIMRVLPEYGLQVCGGALLIIGMIFGLPAIIGNAIGGPGRILEFPHKVAMKGAERAFDASQKYSEAKGTQRKI